MADLVTSMLVGDLVVHFDRKSAVRKIWKVRSACLGAVGIEDLVELESQTELPGLDTKGKRHLTTWVPYTLLQNAHIYRPQQALHQLGIKQFCRVK